MTTEIYSKVLAHYYAHWRQNAIDSVFWLIQDADAWHAARNSLPRQPTEQMIQSYLDAVEKYTTLMTHPDYAVDAALPLNQLTRYRYEFTTGHVMEREYGKTPTGNLVGGRWVLRDAAGFFVDIDRFRNDLIDRHGLTDQRKFK